MARSASGVSVSLSVALSFEPSGSIVPIGAATVAVLSRVPVALGSMVPVAVYVAVPVASRSTLSLMSPLALAEQVDPAEATHVHVTPLRIAGNVSVTVAAATGSGPA